MSSSSHAFASQFKGQVVVVLGATGVVGSGAVRSYLDAGATVVGVSRSAANLDKLRSQMAIGAGEPFHGVVGDFNTEAAGKAAFDAVAAALGGKAIDHVVSSLGFVVIDGAATATPLAKLTEALDGGLINTFVAARTFVPGLKARSGATYTIVSGGFAHGVFAPNLWLGTLKNAAVSNLVQALASETAGDALKVLGACIHFGVAPVGSDKNQMGMPADHDSRSIGDAFLGLAQRGPKGQVVCLDKWTDAEAWGKAA
jgi:NAD(P)-dependent dehydrogenase (short-subunit alcohol dehydrogenase family)